MICKVFSAGLSGIDAYQICVEADVANGLPAFNMVGLPSSEVKEARERVERAIVNSGFDFPARRVTINLSPAYVRKQGSGLDLPIAVSVLASMESVRIDVLKDVMIIGELGLDGSIKPVNGVLSMAIEARKLGFKTIVVPEDNGKEGALVNGINVHTVSNLKQLVSELNKNIHKDVEHVDLENELENAMLNSSLDYCDVVGQEDAKKAVLVAASGFHNLLFIGPPGAGKSMMARRIPTIFGKMTTMECLEVTRIYSVSGLLKNSGPVLERPFRAPNQSITEAALLGGLLNPKPGEITLAHRGVLFLDELTEYKKNLIDGLRIPLENRKIVLSRAGHNVTFPCDFMLVAATNPCKCGYYPDRRYCRCNEIEVNRYLGKLSGPVLDRIDICVGVSKVDSESLQAKSCGMSSMQMRKMSDKARRIQQVRFKDEGILFNSQMSKQQADRFCVMSDKANQAIKKAYDKLNMTARGWYKVLKVARTIADIEESEVIEKNHVMEAIGYRNTYLKG